MAAPSREDSFLALGPIEIPVEARAVENSMFGTPCLGAGEHLDLAWQGMLHGFGYSHAATIEGTGTKLPFKVLQHLVSKRGHRNLLNRPGFTGGCFVCHSGGVIDQF